MVESILLILFRHLNHFLSDVRYGRDAGLGTQILSTSDAESLKKDSRIKLQQILDDILMPGRFSEPLLHDLAKKLKDMITFAKPRKLLEEQ